MRIVVASLMLGPILLSALVLAGAPQSDTAGDAALILGQVVGRGTGEPLSDARVTVRREEGRGQPLAAMSDDDGRFVIGNVAAGSYRLEVTHEGYVDQEYGQVSPGRPGTVLVLVPGQRLQDVVVSMTPTGVITGRVFDQGGRALEGIEVGAMRYTYVDGTRVLETVRMAETNDLGAYRLYWLQPGEYFVSATFNSNRAQVQRVANALAAAIPEVAGRGGQGRAGALGLILPELQQVQDAEPPAEIYVDTYFPGTYDAAKALPVTVAPGSEMSAINFSVSPTRAVTVSGRVTGPMPDTGGSQTLVTLVPQSGLLATVGGGRGRGRGATSGTRDGRFSISGVSPGSYTLVATVQAGGRGGRGRGGANGGVQLSGFVGVEVGVQDLEDVVVEVRPGVTIRGQIWVDEAAAEIDLDRLRVRLEPPRGIPIGSPSARIEEDGSFVLDNVRQTVYRAVLDGLGQDDYLVDARAGGYDALGDGVQVSSNVSVLEFWVSGSGASLDGVVGLPPGLEFTGAQVVLVPQNSDRRDLYKNVSPDQYGRFAMHGIAPGRYMVFAWEDVPPGAWLDPVFVSAYSGRGYAIQVQQGAQIQAQPRLIPASVR